MANGQGIKDIFSDLYYFKHTSLKLLAAKFPSILIDEEKSTSYEVILRLNLNTDDVDNFKKEVSHVTNTEWIVFKCAILNPKRLVFRKTWICQHSSRSKSENSKRNSNCQCKMAILIKKLNRSTIRNDKFLKLNPPLQAEVTLSLQHTHNTSSAEAMKMFRVPDEVKDCFFEYFSHGLTPAGAIQFHKNKFLIAENYEDLNNAWKNPTKRQIYYLYECWRRKNLSTVTEPFEKSIENITFYHSGMKLALIQFAVSSKKEENLQRICIFIKEAAEKGADLICLPECFNSPYGVKYFQQYAESIPGETSETLSRSAKENKIYLVGGSFPEKLGSNLFNTCLVYNPNGELIAKHQKIHLFDIHVPGKISFKESLALASGNSLTTFKINDWTVGIGLGYDIRFSLMANAYADKGCQLLLYPGAFNLTTGPAHWELLQRARALDNQLYVATISTARNNMSSYTAWGHSTITSPWGSVIAEADEKETIVYGDIELSYIDEVRQQLPIRQQQRKDLYNVTYSEFGSDV